MYNSVQVATTYVCFVCNIKPILNNQPISLIIEISLAWSDGKRNLATLLNLSSRIHEFCVVLLTEVELDTILSIRIKGLNFWIINSVKLLHVYPYGYLCSVHYYNDILIILLLSCYQNLSMPMPTIHHVSTS